MNFFYFSRELERTRELKTSTFPIVNFINVPLRLQFRMEPTAKKPRSEAPTSSTPKKCPYSADATKKRKISCPIVLPFLPPPLTSSTSAQPTPLPLPPIPLPIALPIKPDFLLPKPTPKEELKEVYEAHYSDENRSDEDDEFETETPVTTIEATTTETESMELATDETTLEQTVLKNADDEKEKSFEVYTKQIVKHRGGSWVRNTEPLPEGWILINHHAGFPLYFHRESRVVTWSRPYCVGSSSVKAHKIPVTAIPCLAYTKRTVNVPTEEENNEEDKPDEENGLPSVDAQLVKSEIETIDSQALKDYLAKRFDFSEVTCKRYQSHEAYGDAIQRRKDARKRHREKKKELRDNNSRGDEVRDQRV